MKPNLIDTNNFIIVLDLYFSENSINCITSPSQFIDRLLDQVKISKDDEEIESIVGDIVFSSTFTILSSLEKCLIKRTTLLMDEEIYKEFKAFYKQLSIAETKIDFGSEEMFSVLSIMSAVSKKICDVLDCVMEGQNKKIYEIVYINSKIDIKNLNAQLYLVFQIKLE